MLSLEIHLGVTASPQTPFPTDYVTLPVSASHRRFGSLSLTAEKGHAPVAQLHYRRVVHSKHAQAASPPCWRATLAGRTVREICYPQTIGSVCMKLPIHQIQQTQRFLIWHRCSDHLATAYPLHAVLCHQALHGAAGNLMALPTQLTPDLASAIHSEIHRPDLLNHRHQLSITLSPSALEIRIANSCSMAPVGRWGNLQNPADRLDPIVRPVPVNKRVYFSLRSSSA